MNKLEKPAILVVDMLNDFVTGALTCERAKAIVPATAAFSRLTCTSSSRNWA